MGRAPLRIFAAAAAVVLAAGLYALWWRDLAQRIEDQVPDILAVLAEAGLAVTPGTVEVGGFPYRVEVALKGPEIAGAGWRWMPDTLQFFVQPWNLRHIVALGGTAHRFDQLSGQERLTTRALRASLVRGADGELLRFSVEATGVAAPTWSLDRAELHVRRVDGRMDVAGKAEGGRLPHPSDPVLDFVLFEGGLTPEPDLTALASPVDWTRAGGMAHLSRLALAWGPLAGEAEGSLSLDRDLKPQGDLTFRPTDVTAALRFLEAQGYAEPDAARAALDAVAVPARGADPEPVPLTLADGWLLAAGVPLVRVPALAAPGN